MEDSLIRFNIRITHRVHEWFAAESRRTGVSMSGLMCLALEEHIQRVSVLNRWDDVMDASRKLGADGTDQRSGA